ncbi:MAG TPA: S8 family serine peptidase [Acidobacteriaceae bacterium]|jgi:subtilisin family serine protease|nr:S8 family serine peptidase [Acidobacteriaceae bacterium]
MKFKPETELEKILSGLLVALVGISGYLFSRQSSSIDDMQKQEVQLRTFAASTVKKQGDAARFVPNQLIVAFKPSASPAQRKKALDAIGVIVTEPLRPAASGNALTSGPEAGEVSLATLNAAKPVTDSKVLTALAAAQPASDSASSLADRVSLGSAIAQLARNPQVEFVQPNYIYSLADGPNDDLFVKGLLWNMYAAQDGNGQALLTSQFGIQAPPIWTHGTVGSRMVYVAVIDSGIDATHSDHMGNVDVSHKIDLVSNAGQQGDSPFINKDEIGHGTHVAGIIGAIGNNGVGVAGVTWAVQMIPVKVAKAGVNENIDEGTAIKAIEYVTTLKQSGIDVVAANISWGSNGIFNNNGDLIPDNALLSAIKRLAAQGVICVAAAGNNDNNNDNKPFYPANFDTTSAADGTPGMSFNAVVSVAALNPDGTLWPYSNYGRNSVRLAGPGASIVSTIPADSQFARSGVQTFRSSDRSLYAVESGTSVSAPHVSGAIALFYSIHPGATPSETLNAILGTLTPAGSLAGVTISGGRLNVSRFWHPGKSRRIEIRHL